MLLVHGAGVRAELFRPPTAAHPRRRADRRRLGRLAAELAGLHRLRAAPLDARRCGGVRPPRRRRLRPRGDRRRTSRRSIHCQGSTSLHDVGRRRPLPQVDTVVSNAVSLHPVYPAGRVKIAYGGAAVPGSRRTCRPRGATSRGLPAPRSTGRLVNATHHECDNTGLPAGELHLRHRLARAVVAREPRRRDARVAQRRVRRGAVDLLPQMGRCVRAGHLVCRSTTARSCRRTSSPRRRRPTPASCSWRGENNQLLPAREPAADLRASSRAIRPGHDSLHRLPATATSTSSSARTRVSRHLSR